MDHFDFIQVTCERHVMTIAINRPEVLNALHSPAHFELARAFDGYAADPEMRVAILTAVGTRAFCVGSDLKRRAKTNADHHPPTGFAGVTRRYDLTKPVIAAVNGLAVGGGMEIVVACDLAIAAEHAEFGLSEPMVGLAALGGGALQRLARQMPMKEAMWLALTGKRITAAVAQHIGLINEVVPAEALAMRARALADHLLLCAPLALEATKQVMLDSLRYPDLSAAIAANYPAADRMLASDDAKEGQRAFVEKRKPIWKGR